MSNYRIVTAMSGYSIASNGRDFFVCKESAMHDGWVCEKDKEYVISNNLNNLVKIAKKYRSKLSARVEISRLLTEGKN